MRPGLAWATSAEQGRAPEWGGGATSGGQVGVRSLRGRQGTAGGRWALTQWDPWEVTRVICNFPVDFVAANDFFGSKSLLLCVLCFVCEA